MFSVRIISILAILHSLLLQVRHVQTDQPKSYPYLIGVSPDEYTIRQKAPPNAEELAERAGYSLKSYTTTTSDSYILVIHRLLPKHGFRMPRIGLSSKPVVLLQHGVAQSSSEWLINNSGKSLAMMLVDSGYDVWLGNSRGNKYSNSHVTLRPNTMEYFNFTFHEMGVYDFPATVDLILKETKKTKINYVGCSIGATIFFVAMSKYPEYTSKINFMAAISPLAFLTHTKSHLKILAPHLPEIKKATDKLYVMRINPETLPKMINSQLGKLCFWSKLSKGLCNSAYQLLDELGFRRFEEKHLDTLWKYLPTTTSARTCIHLLQLMTNSDDLFDEYDYGADQNIRKYGSPRPPPYDLNNVNVPVGIFSGSEDNFNTKEDIEILKKLLPQLVLHVEVDSTFRVHTDFTHEKKAVEHIFTPLIKTLDSYNGLIVD